MMLNNKIKLLPFFLPSIADMLFVALLFYLASSSGNGLLADGDTGYHIRAGEYILDTLSIPRQDIFSFITPPLQWTAHEWLSEVIMALIHRGAGLTGIVVFFSFLIAVTYYIFFRIIRRADGNIYLAAVLALLVIASSSIHFLARPHIFSLLLMITWYFILDSYQYQHRNYLYYLPLLMLLWVNLHGGYVVGFFLIGVYFMGNLAKYFFGPEEDRQISQTKAFHLGLTGAASLGLSLINPFGYHILLFPFNLVSDKYMMDHVMEFMSPNFHNPYYFKYLLLITIALFAVSIKRLNIIELVLVIFFVKMSLYATRYIPLFSIFVAPIILRQADSLIEKTDIALFKRLKMSSQRVSLLDASTRGFNWPVAAIAIVVILAANGKIGYSFDEKIKPVAAVQFLLKEQISGNMYNNDEFGDYVIYSAHDNYKVFIDGRLDMYGSERLKEYNKVCDIEHDWDNILHKYNIDWIFFNTNSILTRHLLSNNSWKLIYSDKVASIFVRNIPQYQKLIAKYPDVKPVVIEDDKDAPKRN